MALKALESVCRTNGSIFEEFDYMNVHRRKVVGEGKSVSWGGAQTKGQGRDCEPTEDIFLHNDQLKLFLKKNTTSLSSSLTQLCVMIIKLALRGNCVKR